MNETKNNVTDEMKNVAENVSNDGVNGYTSGNSSEIENLNNLKNELLARDAKIKELETELQNQKDKFIRKVAEFENYKRRTELEQSNLIRYAAEPFIVKILNTVDDLERSLQHINENTDIKSIVSGIKLIYDKFMKTLEDQGVKKFVSVGEQFDYNLHDALMQQETTDTVPNTVLQEVQSGYMYKDKVLRHAQVIVATAPATNDDSQVSNENSERENK